MTPEPSTSSPPGSAEVEALRRSEERFRLLASATSDALWDWDTTTDSLWWSDTFYVVFGYDRATFGTTIDRWIACIHPDDTARVTASIKAARDGDAACWTQEYRLKRHDGTVAWVSDRAHILRDATGRAIRLVGGMTDITAQKQLQKQYLHAQRMESIGTLAGGIAHDLNNTLAPILMAIELLKLKNPAADTLKLLDTIETSTRRGAELVRQVLHFARGVEGKKVAVNVRHALKEIARITEETFPRNIAVALEAPRGLWIISADPSQLNQVLLNLAVNARDAMSPAGGTLTLSASNATIDRQLASACPGARPGPHVCIEIKDTGCGIPSGDLDRFFEPFFTTKGVGKGTGLGLSTAHTIAREHGGFLTVASEPGRGASFKIHLPAPPDRQPPPPPPTQAPHPPGAGETVLQIDDEPAILTVTRQTLEAFGYNVLTARDGAEGVALYAQHRTSISAVLTDLAMPIMDGPATIAALRRIDPEVRIIAASGNNNGATNARLGTETVRHFLPKPYSADTLLEIIHEALS